MIGDIIAYRGDDWIGRFIRFILNVDVSHVSIMVADDLMVESLSRGVKLSKYSTRNTKSYILRCPKLTDEQRVKLIYDVMNSIAVKYDYKLFFGILINRVFGLKVNWDDKSKYICVELIVELYRQLGINLLPREPDQEIVPSDLLNSPELVIVDKL
jgi:uncharacterized protein YycO